MSNAKQPKRGKGKRPAPVEPPPSRADDRHKPRRMVGIPERLCAVIEAMGREKETSLTEMAKALLIAQLEALGRWPPPAGK